MAEQLARVSAPMEDRVNCPFYFKIGACRHGDRCVRLHSKPLTSQTVLMPHLYEHPAVAIAIIEGVEVPEKGICEAMRHYVNFYKEMWRELSNYGKLLHLYTCDNLSEHMLGNVYAKFSSTEAAKAALSLAGRSYSGRVVSCELSHVSDFEVASCRQYMAGNCARGGYCSFVHWKL